MAGNRTSGERPAIGGADPAGDEDSRDLVDLLLVLGPQSFSGALGVIGSEADVVLEPLRARLRRIDALTERETVAALQQPCEAVVLAPGVLEHYSGWVADAVHLLEVPVVVARDRQEGELGRMGARLVVTPRAAASVSGGGATALDGAVEAAAWLAWDRRRPIESRSRR